MPITTNWYDDQKRIILVVYDGAYTWDDVYNSAKTTNLLAQSVAYPLATVIDMTRAGAVPPNAASHGKRLRDLRDAKIRFEVVVGASMLVKTLAKVANSVFKIFGDADQFAPHFVDTMPEALDLVETVFISKL